MNDDISFFLFARPSFVSGFGRALDLGGTLTEYNASLTPEQADHLAITTDILALGVDAKVVLANQEPLAPYEPETNAASRSLRELAGAG